MNIEGEFKAFLESRIGYRYSKKNKKRIAEDIKNQREKDYACDQISRKEYIDPFPGSKKKEAKTDSRP